MFDYDVVIGKDSDPSGYPAANVMAVLSVSEIFVIRDDKDGVLGSSE
jgi:hypothetical protein